MKVIKYLIVQEINLGTEDNPNINRDFHEKRLFPYSNANEEIAKCEAYNGEYTIFDDGEPEPMPTEQEQLRADVDFLLAMGGIL